MRQRIRSTSLSPPALMLATLVTVFATASVSAQPGPANPDGSFSVFNSRTQQSKTYAAK